MTPSGHLVLPPMALDRASPVPLHRQLRDQLAAAIRGSAAGARLPSTRVLAQLLGLSRNTVLAAYDDLAADGLIAGRRGAAMVVCAPRPCGPAAFDLRAMMREAGYPARAIAIADADGNPLSLTY